MIVNQANQIDRNGMVENVNNDIFTGSGRSTDVSSDPCVTLGVISHATLNEKAPVANIHVQEAIEDSVHKTVNIASAIGHQILHTDLGIECHICGKTLKNKTNYKRHMFRHNPNVKLSCEICGKRYTDRSNLKQHLNIHEGVFPYKCETCGSMFPSAQKRLAHIKRFHRKAEYCCDLCKKEFRSKRNFRNHLYLHSNPKDHPCFQCHRSFGSSKTLHYHELTHETFNSTSEFIPPEKSVLFDHHVSQNDNFKQFTENGDQTNQSVNKIITQGTNEIKKDKLSYTEKELKSTEPNCVSNNVIVSNGEVYEVLDSISLNQSNKETSAAIFKSVFAHEVNDSKPNRHKNKRRFDLQNKMINRSTRISASQVNDVTEVRTTSNKLICYICGKSHKSFKSYKLHLCMHDPNEEPVCYICQQTCSTYSSLEKHVHSHKQYTCTKCKKSYSSLEQHSKHEQICWKRHKNCKKQFGIKNSVKQSHLQCNVCKTRFNHRKYLLLHMKRHNAKHICDICGKFYVTTRALNEHLNLHKGQFPVKCHVCNQRFPSLQKQVRHVKKEHKHSMFTCFICNKNYASNQNLQHHIKEHKIKKFSCAVCKKLFSDNKRLLKHSGKHENPQSKRMSVKIKNQQVPTSTVQNLNTEILQSDSDEKLEVKSNCANQLSKLQNTSSYKDDLKLQYTSSIKDDSKLQYTGSSKDDSKLQNTSSFKDDSKLQYTGSSKDDSKLQNTCSIKNDSKLQNTGSSKDDSKLQNTCSIKDVSNLQNTSSIKDDSKSQNTSSIKDVSNLQNTGSPKDDSKLHREKANFKSAANPSTGHFNKSKFKLHYLRHSEDQKNSKHSTTYKCGKCDLRFPSKHMCLSHMNKRHNLGKYSCDNCKKSFRCQRKFKYHKCFLDSDNSDTVQKGSNNDLTVFPDHAISEVDWKPEDLETSF